MQTLPFYRLKVHVKPEFFLDFIKWQGQLNHQIANEPGFLSLEIISLYHEKVDWIITQTFRDDSSQRAWKASKENQELLRNLREKLGGNHFVLEMDQREQEDRHSITEVIITEVRPEKASFYKVWMAKIHEAEAKFPGFKGVYVQPPRESQGKTWITLLQFDTPENLDLWLHSAERADLLKESEVLIASLETHRVISSYSGWFSSMAKNEEVPPVWKQTMIVLLVLFPIVMLEIRWLQPWLKEEPLSVGTFIGNAISVSLIAWPLMPLAIFFLGWWLIANDRTRTLLGTVLVVFLYIVEIIFLGYFIY